MYKSPNKHFSDHRDRSIHLPRISLPSRTRQIELSLPKRVNTQSLHSQPLTLSAKSWVIYHINESKILAEHRSHHKREMASLTKIMTAICVIQICRQLKIEMGSTVFRITEMAVAIGGTTANLEAREWISVSDCLYGLLLPSGNDAAMVLAENLGALLVFEKEGQLDNFQHISSLDLTDDQEGFERYINEFIDYMNTKASELRLRGTCFMNPHGLDNYGHYSTCQDMLILTSFFLQYDLLETIANTKCYAGELRIYKNKDTYRRRIYWMNTNKLLGKKGCTGVKTGFTQKAGGCLSTVFEMDGEQLMVVVMGCRTNEDRFVDTSKLIEWIKKKLEISITQR